MLRRTIIFCVILVVVGAFLGMEEHIPFFRIPGTHAQTACAISIATPTAGATIRGYPYTFTESNSNCVGLFEVQYLLNQLRLAVVRTAPYSYVWPSTYWRYSGPQTIQAVALDVYGNTLATSAPVSFIIDNSGGTELMSVTTTTPVTSAWSGTVTIMPHGSGVGAYWLFIDGVNQGTLASINTRKWFNGSHDIYIVDSGPGGLGDENHHTAWEQWVVFGNGSSGNVEIRPNVSYLPMLTGATFRLTCTLYKTDQSTQPCPSPTYAVASPGSLDTRPLAATVSASGLVTAIGPGDATITIMSGSLAATVWVSVDTATNFPQFGKNGTILTAYNSNLSVFPRSWWNFATIPNLTSYPQGASDYILGGANTFEDDPYVHPDLSHSQSPVQWQAAQDSTLREYTSFLAANPTLYLFARGDNFGLGSGPPDGLYTTTRPPWNGWNVGGLGPPAQYVTQRLVNTRQFLGWIFGDEVNVDSTGRNPSPDIWTPGTSGGQITCVKGGDGNCRLDWGGSAPANWGLRTNIQLIISGSSHNTAINNRVGSTWTVTATNSNCSPVRTITFTGPKVNDTWNANNDPNLNVTVMGYQWNNIQGIGPDYVRNDSYTTLVSQIHRAGGHVMWPENGGAIAYEAELSPCQVSEATNYNNRPSLQDFSSMLYQFPHGPGPINGQAFVNQVTQSVYSYARTIHAVKNRNAPIVMQAQGTPMMYRVGGTPDSIASYSNGVFTFNQPHGMSVYRHGVSRLTVQGSSNPNLNGNFVVVSVPSPTQLQVALWNPPQTFSGVQGVATFQDGTVANFNGPSTGMQCSARGKCSITFNNFSGPNSQCANFKWGQTFVVSGATNGVANGSYWYRDGPVHTACTGQQPAIDDARPIDTTDTCNSGCGTGYVITDDDYIPGRNQLVVSGVYPVTALASVMADVIYGAGGIRVYAFGNNVDAWKTDDFAIKNFQGMPSAGDGIQPGASPKFDFAGSVANWTALSLAMNWIGANERYILQPLQVAPHYGRDIAVSVRTGSYGTVLMMLNTTDAMPTRTVNLSPYFIGGNTATRYRIHVYGTSVTTTNNAADTVTFAPGEFIAYLFPSAPALPVQAPVSASLSEVSGAAHVAVEWAYDPHLFPEYCTSNSWIPAQVGAIPCDTGCTIPADLRIKQVYYRKLYTDASRNLIQTGPIRIIPGRRPR